MSSSSLQAQYANRINLPLKAHVYTTVSRRITTTRSCYTSLSLFASLTVVLHFLSLKGKYIGSMSITHSLSSASHNNNSIPLPSSFLSHYTLNNSDVLNTFYSSFQCLNGNPSDLHTEDLWHQRLCIFHNVCLRKNGERTNYTIDYFYPSAMESLKSTIIRSADGALLSLRQGARIYYGDDLSVAQIRLIPVNQSNISDRNSSVVYLTDTYLIYQLLAHTDMNFGHFIFDDVFGLYSNLKDFRSTRFNSPSQNYVLAYKTCSDFDGSLQASCVKFTQGVFPVVTSHSIRSIDSLLGSSNRICFRQLVAGHGRAGAIGSTDNNLHRAQIFDEFRSDLLHLHNINPNFIPRQHQIALIEKTGRRKFTNLNDIYTKIKAAPQYAGIKVTLLNSFVNWTVADQLKLFQTITIVVSPCGGISLLFSFLPAKATLIIPEFPKFEKNEYTSGRMEAVYWDYQSHLNVFHYPVDSTEDFELSADLNPFNYGHLRNNAEINLKTEKLFPLIDRAIIRAFLNY